MVGKGVIETRWAKKDGSIINVILSSTYLDQGDHSQGVIFTALDITDRKTAETELLRSERRLKKAQSIAQVGDWELDVASKTILGSEEATKIYGFKDHQFKMPLADVQSVVFPNTGQFLRRQWIAF